MADHVIEIAAYLRRRVASCAPDIAIVCGSGLSGLADAIHEPVRVPYADIPHFPRATVAGHGTELVFGTLSGVRVVAQRGRFHAYEGWKMDAVTLPVRVFAALGVRVIIVTNAAGGVNAEFRVGCVAGSGGIAEVGLLRTAGRWKREHLGERRGRGRGARCVRHRPNLPPPPRHRRDIMVISDHISFPSMSGLNPLVGPNDARFGPRFPPLSVMYTPLLQELAAETAKVCAAGCAGVWRQLRLGVDDPFCRVEPCLRGVKLQQTLSTLSDPSPHCLGSCVSSSPPSPPPLSSFSPGPRPRGVLAAWSLFPRQRPQL